MQKYLAAMAGAVVMALAGTCPAHAQERWKAEDRTITGWPGWCSRVGIQSVGFDVLFPLEASPCGVALPMLTIIRLSPPGGAETDIDQRFAAMLVQLASPEAKAFHLAMASRQHGSCVQLSHAVDPDPLPGLRAYESRSSHQCDRYAIPADTRSLSILLKAVDGAVWTISFDHPGADLTAEQEALLRRTAAELAGAG